jgi:hypothetical protein
MKSGKLGKLKMPSKDAIDVSELEMDMGPEDGAEVAEEADMGMDMESEPKSGDLLTDIADEDLIAEIKKRGLSAQLAEGEAESGEEEEESSEYM